MTSTPRAELGVALLTFADATLQELVDLGRRAERLGYTRCYTAESLTDSLAIDMAIALGTESIVVGSFVAVTYLRHPIIAAQSAVTISELSGGRFILGLGLGHRSRIESVGVPVGRPMQDLPAYLTDVRALLEGRGRERYPDLPIQTYRGRVLDFRTPTYDLPIYAAALGPEMAEVASAGLADGLMAYLVPRAGLQNLLDASARGAAAVGAPAPVPVDLAVHAFLADDLDVARQQARAALAYWVGLRSYNAALARAGFESEAAELRAAFEAGDQDRLRTGITDAIIDEYCLVGPAAHCRDQLDGWRESGAAVDGHARSCTPGRALRGCCAAHPEGARSSVRPGAGC